MKAEMYASTADVGKITTFGSNGSINAGLSVYTTSPDYGRLYACNTDGDEQAVMWVDSTSGAG